MTIDQNKKQYFVITVVIYAVQLILAICYLVGAELNIFALRAATKAIPLLLLIPLVWFLWDKLLPCPVQQTAQPKRFKPLILLGIAFGALGDILLLFEGIIFLGFGTVSFLTGHVFYIIAFFPTKPFPHIHKIILGAIAVVSFAVIQMFINLRYFKQPALFIPFVIIYFIVEGGLVMTMMLIPNEPARCQTCRSIGVFGSLLFYISDTVLVFGMCLPKGVALRSYIVMITYYAAQFCIAYSYRQFSCHLKQNEYKPINTSESHHEMPV